MNKNVVNEEWSFGTVFAFMRTTSQSPCLRETLVTVAITRGNSRSVLNVMATGIRCGDEITVHCDGPDEKEAIEAVCNLIETGLKE